MPNKQESFLEAIAQDPEDDEVRLIFADYLEDQDDPRGEFIRLQLKLANRDFDRADFTAMRERERERELLDAHFEEWTRDLQPFDSDKCEIKFERGCIEEIRIEDGTDNELDVLERASVLSEVWLTNCTLSETGWKRVTHLKNLVGLELRDTPLHDLALLDSLPCWVTVESDGDNFTQQEWAESQNRRRSKWTRLKPNQRRRAALRFLRSADDAAPFRSPTSVSLS